MVLTFSFIVSIKLAYISIFWMILTHIFKVIKYRRGLESFFPCKASYAKPGFVWCQVYNVQNKGQRLCWVILNISMI